MTSFLPIVDGQDTPQRYKFNTTYEKSYVLESCRRVRSVMPIEHSVFMTVLKMNDNAIWFHHH